MQEFPNRCYCIPGVLVHNASFGACFKASSLSDLTCNQGYLARMTARKCSQVCQTLTCTWNNSTEACATGSSASQHSDVPVRFFESDTRVIERARLGVDSTWVSGNSIRSHAGFTTVVVLSVTVDLVSMFLLRCPGNSDFRGRQVTSTQCTQLTLEKLDLALHGGKRDGIDLTTFSLSDINQQKPVSLLNTET